MSKNMGSSQNKYLNTELLVSKLKSFKSSLINYDTNLRPTKMIAAETFDKIQGEIILKVEEIFNPVILELERNKKLTKESKYKLILFVKRVKTFFPQLLDNDKALAIESVLLAHKLIRESP